MKGKDDRWRNSRVDLYVVNTFEHLSIDRLARLTAEDSRERTTVRDCNSRELLDDASCAGTRWFSRFLVLFLACLPREVTIVERSTGTDDPLRIVASFFSRRR